MCRMNRDGRGDASAATANYSRLGGEGAGQGAVSHLMYACQQGDVDAVRRILHVQGRTGATQRDRTGKTALHYCCTSKSRARAAQAADILTMAAPELVDGRDEDGFTPLHLAVIAGNVPLVNFLLASNADFRAVDAEQHTVVHWATVCGETEALRAVLAAGAPISTPDVHGGYPLHYAAQMCASQDKDSELGLVILQTLLTHSKTDVTVRDGDGRQPLLWAASAGSPKAMLALIRAGAAVEASDKDGLTALHCAASRGHTECLDTLLTLCGAGVDVIDSNGCTALHYAVTLGHADATALLLAHGANANRQDRKGRTPAHCGCAKGQFETVKMLSMHDANLWLRNARGDLPLHEAAASGRRDLVKWLLDAKPSHVNSRNNDGRCPLHLAALNDNADMCKILIDHGAAINPVLRTSKNVFMTPLDCALNRGFRSTAKYLQLQGGLPASKLGTVGSTIQVNIKENITVDMSQSSEDESQEVEPIKKKTKKKRSAKKGEVAVVNTAVTVTERKVDIQQNKSLKLGGSSSQETPKASKERLPRPKTKKDTPDPRRKATQTHIELSPLRINENIKEINTLAQSIEAKAKSICQEVNIIESNLDEQSLTSFEEGQQSKQLLVEAAVHPPPTKPTQDPIHQQYQDVIKSLKDELDAMKQEIRCLKRVEVQTVTEATRVPGGGAGENVGDTLKELKSLLEGRVKEIKETVEDFKLDVKSAMGVQAGLKTQSEPNLSDVKIDIELIRGLEKKVRELERATERMQQEADTKEVAGSGDRIRSRSSSGRKKAKKEKKPEDEIEVYSEELHGTRKQIQETLVQSQVTVESRQILPLSEPASSPAPVPATEPTPDTNIDLALNLESQALEEPAFTTEGVKQDGEEGTDDIFGETITQQTREEMLKMTSEIEAKMAEPPETGTLDIAIALKSDEVIEQPTESASVLPAEPDDANAKAFEVLQTTVEDNPLSIDETAPETEADEPKAFEILPQVSEERDVDVAEQPQDSPDAPTETDPEPESKAFEILQSSPTHQPEKERFIKSAGDKDKEREKRDHHLHLPRDEQLESSLDDNENSESSFSSTATKREHKSFTVIEPQTTSIGKGLRASATEKKKKLRSRSEEMRKNQENMLRRSKIPVTLEDAGRRRAKSNLESRVPFLPELGNKYKTKSETNIATMEEFSEHSDEEVPAVSDSKRKRVKKRTKSRTSKSAGSDYESSNLIDSGFEPSPRSTRIPKWRHVSDRGVNMTSVTQSIQGNIRRYHLERKIFQHLLELKRLQIRAGQHNESMLVKRAIDTYHRTCASTVGGGRYIPQDFTFKSFERFLYESLRKIQKTSAPAYLRGLPEAVVENPLFCTQNTNRCMHATHAYTGIPCAAYLPQMDHHTIPKIGYTSATCRPQGFLPEINKKAVTLELCHGNDKQVISLPTDRLDQNKRYYVTFTVKGEAGEGQPPEDVKTPSHQHSKSM